MAGFNSLAFPQDDIALANMDQVVTIADHFAHHAKDGDRFNNMAEGRPQKAPRPPYRHQAYPSSRYHVDGEKSQLVQNAEQDKALGDDWRDTPQSKKSEVKLDLKAQNDDLQLQLAELRKTVAGITGKQK